MTSSWMPVVLYLLPVDFFIVSLLDSEPLEFGYHTNHQFEANNSGCTSI